MERLLVLVLVAALAAAGSARAEAVRMDDVVLDGPLLLPDGGRVEGAPLAVFLDGAQGLRTLSGTFPVVRVYAYELHEVAFPPVSSHQVGPKENRTYVLHDVTMELAPEDGAEEAPGFLGLHVDRGRLAFDLVPGSTVGAAGLRVYGNTDTPGAGESPATERYARRVGIEHVSIVEAGLLAYEGHGGLKLKGPDVTLRARENTTTLSTGEVFTPFTSSSQAAGERVKRWVFLEFPQGGVLRMESKAPYEVAFAEASATWAGRVTLRPAPGSSLGMEGGSDGRAVSLVGEFSADLRVTTAGDGPTLVMDLRGQGVSAADAATRAARPGWLPLVAVLALALAGAATGYFVHRRRRVPVGVEEMVTLAHLAGEGGRHDEALAWIRRARAIAPASGALALEEAFHLGELGLVREALEAYRVAAQLQDDGQAEFDAALLALRTRALADEEVARLLSAALDKNPGLLLELEDLGPSTPRPPASAAYLAAVQRARERLGP